MSTINDDDVVTDIPEEGAPHVAPDPAPQGKDTEKIHWDGQAKVPETRWLVKNLLPEVGTALLSGQWGTHKTFTVMDLGAAVITGKPFAGHRVKRRGGVLIFAAEGASTFPKRLKGLKLDERLPDTPQPFAWLATCPPLTSPNALTELEKMARQVELEMKEKWKVPLALIAIDTLVAAARFKDESSAAEGQAVMNVLTELSKKMKACVIGVDHFGKSTETGTRGTSAKEGAVDAVLALLGDRTVAGAISNCKMAVRKLREGQSGVETRFNPREVQLGTDEDGDPITTCVIDWDLDYNAKEQPKVKRRWSKGLLTLRRALKVVLASDDCRAVRPFGMEGPEVRAIDQETLRSEFYKIVVVSGDDAKKQAQNKKKAFSRAVKDASNDELIGVRELNGQTMIWLAQDDN
jgi:hypothetical protein